MANFNNTVSLFQTNLAQTKLEMVKLKIYLPNANIDQLGGI